MATMNISLSEKLKAFAQQESNNAGYSNPSDYVRTLIREAKERKEARQKIETLLLEGVNSIEAGKGVEMNSNYWQKKRARLSVQATKK